jgi:hypothetical protein
VESAQTSIINAVKTAETEIEKASESVGESVLSAKSTTESILRDTTSESEIPAKAYGKKLEN